MSTIQTLFNMTFNCQQLTMAPILLSAVLFIIKALNSESLVVGCGFLSYIFRRPLGEEIMINFTIFFIILYNLHHRHQPLQHDIQYHVHRHRYAFLITAL